MEWSQVLILAGSIIGANIALFAWLKSDIQQNRAETNADRRDFLMLVREIKDELKDFHGRLCAIEERNKGK